MYIKTHVLITKKLTNLVQDSSEAVSYNDNITGHCYSDGIHTMQSE